MTKTSPSVAAASISERPPRRPELLAPAGTWDAARAAVANGADAVYFGLPRFNARMRAENFLLSDLEPLLRFLHQHHVKGYAAFNVLVFTEELCDARELLLRLRDAGIDAVIVQDVGIANMAVTLGIPVHASTQMTLTSPEGVRFARRLGARRCVLARENSLREIANFPSPDEGGLPLEVFVHGALCVAYSGQCLTSESLGQRSANRGECAQACRLPYKLIVDGVQRDLGDKRYLLSPQDLAAVEEIPHLIELGVASFKIEGRLKSPEYVAAVTRVYRKAIDDALAGRSISATEKSRRNYQLEMAFSRGLSTGWLHGVNHQELVHARFGKKRGAIIGRVTAKGHDWIETDASGYAAAAGDGIVIDRGEDTEREQGGRLRAVHNRRLIIDPARINTARVPLGAFVWKTDDPSLDKTLRDSFADVVPHSTTPLHFTISGQVGQPLVLCARTDNGLTATVSSKIPLQPAQKRPLTTATFREQLGRLGNTPYHLGSLAVHLADNAILPFSELAEMRRAVVSAILSQPALRAPSVDASAPRELSTQNHTTSDHNVSARCLLAVLCRKETQILPSIEAGADMLYLDFEDLRRYGPAVQIARSRSIPILLATPRIQKAGEAGFFRLIQKANPDGVLIRNLGAIEFFEHARSSLTLVGDFSLNVANPLTAEYLKNCGLNRLTPSYDLNIDQLCALLDASPPAWFEVVIHQHMPLFHMEHCVFAAFMSKGRDFRECGRPCERHDVQLEDRVGQRHPLRADVGCRNTLFNGRAQTAADFFARIRSHGTNHFRVELLDEDADAVSTLLKTYRQMLDGHLTGTDLLKRVSAASQLGVIGGTLTVM